jgi:hypothetical protein
VRRLKAWLRNHKRPIIRWTVVVLFICAIAALQVNTSNQPAPFDPTSTQPDGTKAFAMLMQQTGAQFNVGDEPGNGVALLMNDNLSDNEASDLVSWVKGGGTLVVTDTYSQLSDGTAINPPSAQPTVLRPQCDASYTDNVGPIEPNTNADYTLFEQDDGTTSACFPVKNGFFIVAHEEGRGRVVDVGSPSIFTNQDIAKLDNSVLVTNLMQPGPGTDITWLTTQDEGGARSATGSAGLWQLQPPRVAEGWWQLIFAAVALSLWRGRRLGKPVEEPQQVEIAASQLVVAAGNLLQTANQASDAASILRADLMRSLATLLGVPPNVDMRVLIDVAHARTGIPVERLTAVLYGVPVADNTELIKLAQQIEYLQMEVGRVR